MVFSDWFKDLQMDSAKSQQRGRQVGGQWSHEMTSHMTH